MSDVQYQAVIGLEIHVQLKTASKMFCRCSNDSEGAAPNTNICPVCYGLPGALPVPNRTAVEWAIKASTALGCEIAPVSKFDRKQYYYPDLPKGYQISQYDQPFGGPGTFEFDMEVDGKLEPRTVGITRLHLEEDAGKLTHPKGAHYSLVDLNRAGTPLMEIVTDPIECSLEEAPTLAKTFLQELRLLMRCLDVSDADMEKGHLRADANISIHPTGSKEWGSKVEIKNINSFKFVERGIRAEIIRQQEVLAAGEKIAQETRGYDEATGNTVSQRSKEEAMDYRYFPEPDIPPIETSQLNVSLETFETPVAVRRRWRATGLPGDLVEVAVQDRAEAHALDASLTGDAAQFGKVWLTMRTEADDFAALGTFVAAATPLMADGSISAGQLKPLLAKVKETGRAVSDIIENDPEFKQTDAGELEQMVADAIAANPAAVADVKRGNPNAKNVIVGTVMKATKGSANPTSVSALIDEKLEKS